MTLGEVSAARYGVDLIIPLTSGIATVSMFTIHHAIWDWP